MMSGMFNGNGTSKKLPQKFSKRMKLQFYVVWFVTTLFFLYLITIHKMVSDQHFQELDNAIVPNKYRWDGPESIRTQTMKNDQTIESAETMKVPTKSPVPIFHEDGEESDYDPRLQDLYNEAISNSYVKTSRAARRSGQKKDDEQIEKLPSYTKVIRMYGEEPVVVGLDTCKAFQTSTKKRGSFIGVAGLFNSGTHLLFDYLSANCVVHRYAVQANSLRKKQDVIQPQKQTEKINQDNSLLKVKNGRGFGRGVLSDKKKGLESGILEVVPWGKHVPPEMRGKYKAKERVVDIDESDVLPVVITKDPYTWMSSMCRHPYEATWLYDKDHCPNLVPNEIDVNNGWSKSIDDKQRGIPVFVPYNERWFFFDNLAAMWNDWYGGYFRASEYPRLILRYEDILFHPKKVIGEVCACAGGTMKDDFKYVVMNSKASMTRDGSDFRAALMRYGNPSKRIETFTERDINFSKEHLDAEVMKGFGYVHPEQGDIEKLKKD